MCELKTTCCFWHAGRWEQWEWPKTLQAVGTKTNNEFKGNKRLCSAEAGDHSQWNRHKPFHVTQLSETPAPDKLSLDCCVCAADKPETQWTSEGENNTEIPLGKTHPSIIYPTYHWGPEPIPTDIRWEVYALRANMERQITKHTHSLQLT